MRKNKLFVFCISSLIILGVIGLSGVGFAAFVPPPDGGSPPPPPPPCDKYGFFFYSTDAGHDAGNVVNADKVRCHIENYRQVLLAKGYSEVFVYEDVGSLCELTGHFSVINDLEDEYDALFFYICGHGYYDGNSHVALEPNGFVLSSSDFNNLLNDLDTTKIGFLVESCESGGFVLHFADDPYLAMTSSDINHDSILCKVTGEGFFSNSFWYHAEFHSSNAEDCWDVAAFWNWFPNPQIFNGLSAYTFF